MASSIFHDGKLQVGIYMIQNLASENYLDLHLQSMELCCRPEKDLGKRRGFWEIKRIGGGYGIWRVHTGDPEESCSLLQGYNDGQPLSITSYPLCWKVVDAGSGYLRFQFGSTNRALDLSNGSKENGARVQFWSMNETTPNQKWKLIPVRVPGVTLQSSAAEAFGMELPPFDENEPGQSSVRN